MAVWVLPHGAGVGPPTARRRRSRAPSHPYVCGLAQAICAVIYLYSMLRIAQQKHSISTHTHPRDTAVSHDCLRVAGASTSRPPPVRRRSRHHCDSALALYVCAARLNTSPPQHDRIRGCVDHRTRAVRPPARRMAGAVGPSRAVGAVRARHRAAPSGRSHPTEVHVERVAHRRAAAALVTLRAHPSRSFDPRPGAAHISPRKRRPRDQPSASRVPWA